MTNQHHPCATAHCSRPATAVICWGCTTDVVTALRQLACGPAQRTRTHVVHGEQTTIVDYLPGLLADLEQAGARQTSSAGHIGVLVRSAETAIPYHEAATNLGHEVRNTITTWARVLLDEHAHLEIRDTSTTAVAGWLSLYPALLAMLPGAGEMVDEIVRATDRVRRMVDNSPAREFVGRCGFEAEGEACQTPLYAFDGAKGVHCDGCGSMWDVDERRRWLLHYADTQTPMTATEIAGLLALVGVTVTAARIRSLAKPDRKRITAVGVDNAGHPTYLLADVKAALARRYRRRAAS